MQLAGADEALVGLVCPQGRPDVVPDPLALVLLRAMRQDVDTVLVGGEIVFRDGAPTRFDLTEALRALADEVAAGDYPSKRAVAARLSREWAGTPTRVHAIEEYYRAATVDFPQLLKSRGYREDEVGTHAGLADTSLMLAVDPRLVRSLAARPGPAEMSGVAGDPTHASADLGQLGVELIVSRTVEAIRKAVANR